MKRWLVTGGAGFIGSNFVHYILNKREDVEITVLDKLTYAGKRENLQGLLQDPRLHFIQGDIADRQSVEQALQGASVVINFAAETHVDRSLLDPADFIGTNVRGTYVLLEVSREAGVQRFIQISTDEVYGPLLEGEASEDYPLNPTNPYSASKAGADLLVLSYYYSFRLPVLIVRGCNNLGPRQYPEKMIPVFLSRALENRPLPLYGDGLYIREWMFVEDFCSAIETVLEKGQPGEIYNAGTGETNRRTQIQVAESLLLLLGKPKSLIQFVKDRPGHDRRYALCSQKLRALGWSPRYCFEEALKITVEWYLNHPEWWGVIRTPQLEEYYQRIYQE